MTPSNGILHNPLAIWIGPDLERPLGSYGRVLPEYEGNDSLIRISGGESLSVRAALEQFSGAFP